MKFSFSPGWAWIRPFRPVSAEENSRLRPAPQFAVNCKYSNHHVEHLGVDPDFLPTLPILPFWGLQSESAAGSCTAFSYLLYSQDEGDEPESWEDREGAPRVHLFREIELSGFDVVGSFLKLRVGSRRQRSRPSHSIQFLWKISLEVMGVSELEVG
jgi:hypothetical protein